MYPQDADLTHLAARKLELDAGLSFLRAAAAAACETKPKPPLEDGNSRVGKNGGGGTQSTLERDGTTAGGNGVGGKKGGSRATGATLTETSGTNPIGGWTAISGGGGR